MKSKQQYFQAHEAARSYEQSKKTPVEIFAKRKRPSYLKFVKNIYE